jgi:hypothetical protein
MIHSTATGAARFVGLALLGAVVCAVGPANAQQIGSSAPDPYTNLSQYLVLNTQPAMQQAAAGATTAILSSSVSQIGQNNIASASLLGAGNVTSQYQNGANNSSALALNGAQNLVATSQIGNSNSTAISVIGNGNSISNLQVGSGLTYQLQVIGTSAPISIQQYGRK